MCRVSEERRHYQRKTGHEAIDYYVLKVRPTAKGGFEEIDHGQAAALRREYGVRGHFKYYDPERPLLLFGRAGQHGMLWIPGHERGDVERGTIEKGYQVEADDAVDALMRTTNRASSN